MTTVHTDRFATTRSYSARITAVFSFFLILLSGLTYGVFGLQHDMAQTGGVLTTLSLILLASALFTALVFEFVNGFHDTANAVATVIYTNSMPPPIAVMWSGFFNFLGVLLSSGAVAFGVIALLPVELILQVGSGKGFAMVFALLIAAVSWNLATWYFGLPASSSHTLIGSILGVGLVNGLMSNKFGSGVDWAQAAKVGYALLLSPLTGFSLAVLTLFLIKFVIRNPNLHVPPQGKEPPPLWIRAIAVATCTGVSFAHGSNDGQKGIGLIMLILVGMLPVTYAFNYAAPASQINALNQAQQKAFNVLPVPTPALDGTGARQVLSDYLSSRQYQAQTLNALSTVLTEVHNEVSRAKGFNKLNADQVNVVRKDLYLITEVMRRTQKDPQAKGKLNAEQQSALIELSHAIDAMTRFIPTWVKVMVALALGLGTMVGWKRIVITVGEKIGKDRLTYAQGSSAELVTMMTISAANIYGLPVSTTHVLSSAVTGTMVANGTGLQLKTVRNIVMAWILTLPAAIVLSGGLYALFSLFV